MSQVSKRRHVDRRRRKFKLNLKVRHFPFRQLTEISTPTYVSEKKSENELKKEEQKLIQGCAYILMQVLLAFSKRTENENCVVMIYYHMNEL